LVAPSSYFMKSPPRQIHDDIAFNRVEAFIRGDDNETLVGTEKAPAPKRRKLGAHQALSASSQSAANVRAAAIAAKAEVGAKA
ncbi:MAG: hypothetical protein ABI797_06965, partial [Chloroflexota bacterium]